MVLLAIVATPVEVGGPLERNQWPLHITLVGNFGVDPGQEAAAAACCASAARAVSAFDVSLGPAAQFGKRGENSVLLADHPHLGELHALLATALTQLPGFEAAEPAYWTEGYRPHVTLGPAVSAIAGDRHTMSWMTLVALEGRIARPISTHRLGRPDVSVM